MATFSALKNKPYFLSADDCYIVNGQITEHDVKKINSRNKDIILILNNTKNQNRDVIKQLNDKVKISVIGGLDYLNKRKFQDITYVKRTLYSPTSLSKIIEYFEKIESKIRYTWSDKQKCMFVYKTLAEYLHYKYLNESDYENNKDVVRSLDGLLYGKLVCSGFALVFKEAMDRLGITCYYQNKQHHHSWNIVELEGKHYGMELTWDCSNKAKDNRCNFYYFGRDKDFYKNEHHNISSESEEIRYNLSEFSIDKLKVMYSEIKNINGNVMIKDMDKFVDNEGNVIYYIRLKKQKDYYKYMVFCEDKLKVVYLNADDYRLLTKTNIDKGYIGDIKDNEYMSYTRKDGSQFLIKKSKKLDNNMFELYYYEVNSNENQLRRGILLSEMDLSLEYDEYTRNIIANSLLSKDRVARKINYYNGYVGYFNFFGNLRYNDNFEKDELGIVARKK